MTQRCLYGSIWIYTIITKPNSLFVWLNSLISGSELKKIFCIGERLFIFPWSLKKYHVAYKTFNNLPISISFSFVSSYKSYNIRDKSISTSPKTAINSIDPDLAHPDCSSTHGYTWYDLHFLAQHPFSQVIYKLCSPTCRTYIA